MKKYRMYCFTHTVFFYEVFIRSEFIYLKGQISDMIGKIVKVIVDRPLGTFHPKHKDIFYSVNYGFIPGIIAADGEEQDAYILGIDEPVAEFTGKVIAIIHRFDDVEEKWVVSAENISFSKSEIEKLVYFQEKFFDIEIRM